MRPLFSGNPDLNLQFSTEHRPLHFGLNCWFIFPVKDLHPKQQVLKIKFFFYLTPIPCTGVQVTDYSPSPTQCWLRVSAQSPESSCVSGQRLFPLWDSLKEILILYHHSFHSLIFEVQFLTETLGYACGNPTARQEFTQPLGSS